LWRRPPHALIFPSILKERLDDDETNSLLLHELGHFARAITGPRAGAHLPRRPVVAPAVWFACRQLEEVEEHCCDAWVSRANGPQRSYAEALLPRSTS